MGDRLAAVVVDHNAGPLLAGCVRSLLNDGADTVVVVENGEPKSATTALGSLLAEHPDADVVVVRPDKNVGFGSGVNRGLGVLAGAEVPPAWVLVANPDLRLHPGALAAMRTALEERPAWAIVGPRIYNEDATVYPSVRHFPGLLDAAGHALLALFNPENRFTKHYNPGTPEGEGTSEAGWVSGSCFLARRSALEELGGFDEAYFMYAEDMDLCWRAHEAGWGVGFAGAAAITHIQGASTARHPYKMMLSHHRSALRFTNRTTSGWRRVILPVAALVLALRMAIATVRLARRTQLARRRSALVVLVAALGILAGCGAGAASAPKVHIEPDVNFALPPASAGCAGATALAGGATRLPITVSKRAGQVAETINVCIDGKGPFPFVIDTGAGESIIAANLAKKLDLPHAGAGEEFAGVGCVGSAQPVAVGQWSAAGLSLAPQDLTAATLPDFGVKGQPVGLLGSDVLGRFGVVRMDFVAQTLTLAGPQGPAPHGNDVVNGPSGPPPPAALTNGGAGTTVPLNVIMTPGEAAMNVQLRFGHGGQRTFTVDTGSSQSVVNTAVAKLEKLAPTDLAQRQATVCSTITTPLVHSGVWSIPGLILHPQLIGTAPFGPIAQAGLLGSDQLFRYGWVVFDYSGGRLVLG